MAEPGCRCCGRERQVVYRRVLMCLTCASVANLIWAEAWTAGATARDIILMVQWHAGIDAFSRTCGKRPFALIDNLVLQPVLRGRV